MAQDLQQPSADSLRLDPFYGTLFIDWSTMPDPSEVSEEDRQGMADLQDLENELIERYWLSVHLDLVSDPEVARTLCHPFDEEFDAFTQLNTTAEAWARKPWTAERKVLKREHYKRLMSLEQEERGQMDWFRHSLRLPGRLQWRNAGSLAFLSVLFRVSLVMREIPGTPVALKASQPLTESEDEWGLQLDYEHLVLGFHGVHGVKLDRSEWVAAARFLNWEYCREEALLGNEIDARELEEW